MLGLRLGLRVGCRRDSGMDGYLAGYVEVCREIYLIGDAAVKVYIGR